MKTSLRALLVEDSEDDAMLVVRQLRDSGYTVTWERVETAGTMRAALDRRTWDIVICDYQLPSFDGLAALRLLHEAGLDLPVIIVSGTIGEDIAVGAMKAGAHDYLMKGQLARLAPAVERELREAASRRERRLVG
ncbi:MAG: response regulator [Opitutae bacterium]|nr:response regulator [Opitutae bacterium]